MPGTGATVPLIWTTVTPSAQPGGSQWATPAMVRPQDTPIMRGLGFIAARY